MNIDYDSAKDYVDDHLPNARQVGAPMWRALQGVADRKSSWVLDAATEQPVYTVNQDYEAAKDLVTVWLPDCILPPPVLQDTFEKWIFPVIGNVGGMQNIVDDLIAVQPMAGPAAHIFYLDLVHSKSWWKRLRSYLHDAIKNLLRRVRLRAPN